MSLKTWFNKKFSLLVNVKRFLKSELAEVELQKTMKREVKWQILKTNIVVKL